MDECAILKFGNKYYFYDYPEPDFPDRDKIVRIVDSGKPTGIHRVIKSAVWEDLTGYVDALQDEESLPEGRYIVCYWRYDHRGDGLEQLVDWDIAKDEIIQNVTNQRYVEGAGYYLMTEGE